MPFHPGTLPLVLDQLGHRARQLVGCLVARRGLEDPRLRLDHLAERPVGDALAVRQRPSLPPGDEIRVLVDDTPQLLHEPALADPGDADQRDQLGLPLGPDTLQRGGEQCRFALAADEGRPTGAAEVDAEPGAGGDRTPGRDRLRLPLRRHRVPGLVVDHAIGGAVGLLPDENATRWRRRLESGAGVDHVPRDHALTLHG